MRRSTLDRVRSLFFSEKYIRQTPPFLRLQRCRKKVFHFPKKREGERNPNPSLPLKLHRLRKSANTTKCTPPCASVLAFHKHFSRRYVSSLLDPNAYAQDIDLVALDSRANRDCPLDSRLCILNLVNHFSTHLRPAKGKPYGYTFSLRS
jgi:hypothetical protein